MIFRLAFVLALALCSCSKPAADLADEQAAVLEESAVSLSFVRAMDHGYTTYSNSPDKRWNGWSAIMKLNNPTDKSISFHTQGLSNPMVHCRSWRGDVFTNDPNTAVTLWLDTFRFEHEEGL